MTEPQQCDIEVAFERMNARIDRVRGGDYSRVEILTQTDQHISGRLVEAVDNRRAPDPTPVPI